MPQLPWTEIANNSHARHLVVGTVEDGSFISSVRLIERLLRTIPISGDYGVGSMRDDGKWEMHCVFELGADADLLANALHAHSVNRYDGWMSQRCFVLDAQVRKLIALVLTSGKGREYVRSPGRRK